MNQETQNAPKVAEDDDAPIAAKMIQILHLRGEHDMARFMHIIVGLAAGISSAAEALCRASGRTPEGVDLIITGTDPKTGAPITAEHNLSKMIADLEAGIGKRREHTVTIKGPAPVPAAPAADVPTRVQQLVAAYLAVEERDVTPEKRFVEDFSVDSLDSVELVMHLEDEFGIEFTDEEAEAITTVQGAIDAVNRKTATA